MLGTGLARRGALLILKRVDGASLAFLNPYRNISLSLSQAAGYVPRLDLELPARIQRPGLDALGSQGFETTPKSLWVNLNNINGCSIAPPARPSRSSRASLTDSLLSHSLPMQHVHWQMGEGVARLLGAGPQKKQFVVHQD